MKTQATLLGLAIGDALGQPFEFSTAKQIIESGWKGDLINSSFGYEGMFKLDQGQWTDDTKMALCIANSLIDQDGFDIDDLAKKYIAWVESRDVRGIGIRTESSIHNMMRGISPLESGTKHAGRAKPSFKRISVAIEDSDSDHLHGPGDFCGCGTVMRCAPIGVFYYKSNDKLLLIDAAHKDATITHNHPDARDSSKYICLMISHLLNGVSKESSVKLLQDSEFEYDHISRLTDEAIETANDPESTFANGIQLGVAGTAHETLASALFCFLKFETFKEVVTSAVLIGGDTDSRAAIAGALAGAYYGIEGIPKEWVEQVEESEMIQDLDKKLFNR